MHVFCELTHFFGQMDLRVGSRSCTGSAADERPHIGAIPCCFRFLSLFPVFKLERLECEWGRKMAQNFALFDPRGKWERAGGDVYTNYSYATHRF